MNSSHAILADRDKRIWWKITKSVYLLSNSNPADSFVNSYFESCMRNVILSNRMHFLRILMKNFSLTKAMTLVYKFPETPCSQEFSPFSVLRIFLQQRENSGRKRGI